MIKEIQETTEQYIQFTPEELERLGLKTGQKFTISEEDGTIILQPWTSIEIDIGEFDRETLEWLVRESCERDISVGDIMNEALGKSATL